MNLDKYYEKLMTCIQTFSQNECNFFMVPLGAIVINKNVKEFNHQKLKELHETVTYIPAIHSCFKAKSLSSELLDVLEPLVLLSNGSKVMLHSNLLVKKISEFIFGVC